MSQLDLFSGGATPVEALDWPAALRELAKAQHDLGRLDVDEAGAIVHELAGKHPRGQRCPYDGAVGRDALQRLRRREGEAVGQTRSPRLADNPAAPRPRSRRTDPETSALAAKSAARDLRANQAAVLNLFVGLGPMDDVTLLEAYVDAVDAGAPRQSPSGLRTRRHELVELEKLRDSGRKVILESGRQAIVWEASPTETAYADEPDL